MNFTNQDGRTPLFTCCNCHVRVDIARLLIENGADVNMESDGVYTLRLASSDCNVELMELLLCNGANSNSTDHCGNTPVHCAIYRSMLEEQPFISNDRRLIAVKLLLNNKAQVNCKNTFGQTPLHFAYYYIRPNIEVVNLLINHGADIDSFTIDGRLPDNPANKWRVRTDELLNLRQRRHLYAWLLQTWGNKRK